MRVLRTELAGQASQFGRLLGAAFCGAALVAVGWALGPDGWLAQSGAERAVWLVPAIILAAAIILVKAHEYGSRYPQWLIGILTNLASGSALGVALAGWLTLDRWLDHPAQLRDGPVCLMYVLAAAAAFAATRWFGMAMKRISDPGE